MSNLFNILYKEKYNKKEETIDGEFLDLKIHLCYNVCKVNKRKTLTDILQLSSKNLPLV